MKVVSVWAALLSSLFLGILLEGVQGEAEGPVHGHEDKVS